jgi:hypothetical protein
MQPPRLDSPFNLAATKAEVEQLPARQNIVLLPSQAPGGLGSLFPPAIA